MRVPPSGFPEQHGIVDLAGLGGPRFLVTIDTEEEFDWSRPFSRDATSVSHLVAVPRFQAICEAHGVVPLYLADYPVAIDPRGAEILGSFASTGRAEIGLQLHPWVTPPHDEEITVRNSYACNLPPALEREKLLRLDEAVRSRLAPPLAYRAGRYGASANAAETLCELGIRIDTSVRSLFDYRAQGGPNYANCSLSPFWLAADRLIELPLTTVFGGALRGSGEMLFDRAFRSDTMRSLLSRTGLLERIALTPEGIPAEKAMTGIDVALELGLPVLVFSFHSPSLAPGHTPYVRNDVDVEQFYHWWERIFAHLRARNVRPTSIAEIDRAAFPAAT